MPSSDFGFGKNSTDGSHLPPIERMLFPRKEILMNATNVMDNTQNRSAESLDQMSGTTERATERFVQMKDRVWDKSRGLARGVDTCVHDHTWMALGITAAVGIILGLAVSRR